MGSEFWENKNIILGIVIFIISFIIHIIFYEGGHLINTNIKFVKNKFENNILINGNY